MSVPKEARRRNWKIVAREAWIFVMRLLDKRTSMSNISRPEVVRSARIIEM
jgi:hypothetical protein